MIVLFFKVFYSSNGFYKKVILKAAILMKSIFIYFMFITYGLDSYSMKNNIRLEVTIQETFEIFAQEGCTFQASEDAKNYIKTLTTNDLNQLTYSIEDDFISLIVYKNENMVVNGCKKGFSLVHLAIEKDLWWLIDALKKQGANLALQSLPEAGSLTPLQLAYQKKHWQSIKALLMAGLTSKDDPFVLELVQIFAPNAERFPYIWRLLKNEMKSNL